LTDGRRIVKERFSIPLENDLTADLDVYGERLDGLRVVEVEFSSETGS
jgi:hypothetical protein